MNILALISAGESSDAATPEAVADGSWFHPGAILSVLAFGSLIGWIVWRWSRRSEDPPGILILKLLISGSLISAAVWSITHIHPLMGVPIGALCGIIAGGIWGRNVGAALASPLASLYDGGDEAPQPKPFYAIAEAHRKQARYDAAILEIEKQLDLFPGDPQGLLLVAEIRCRHLRDWTGAGVAIDQIVGRGELPVPLRAKALQALADWYIDLGQDAAGSRAVLQRIIDLFPNTPESTDAAQRLAHTGDGEWRREQHAPTLLRVIQGDPHLGLRSGPLAPPPEADPEIEVRELQAQLLKHPLDTDAGERLALLYGDRMGRLDWAVGEIEKLLGQPNHPPKLVARWLHMLADLQVRVGGDEAAAREALKRIGSLFPGTALEANAQTRLDRLKLEMRLKRTTEMVRPNWTS